MAARTAAVSHRRVRALIAGLALLVRLGLASRAAVFLDRLFVPDDTYYTLAIARSLARGLGPTVDGVHLTSGFQPLLAFLLVPVVQLAPDDPEIAFRGALVIGAAADALTAWLLGSLAFRIARSPMAARIAAAFATTAWAVSSAAIAASMNGLETSLALACAASALVVWAATPPDAAPSRWIPTGALLGLCLLARVDTVFLVVLLGAATLLRAGGRPFVTIVTSAVVVVTPWWSYAFARFGGVVPESGAAVREQTAVYAAAGSNLQDRIAWAAGAAVGPPLLDWTWLREALGSGASAIGLAVGVTLVSALLLVARDRRQSDALRVLAAWAACVFLFYVLYLPATWFFRRYLVPVHAAATVALALAFAAVGETHASRPTRARVVLAGAAVSLALAVGAIVRFYTAEPAITVDQGHHGAKGYREPARQVLAAAPSGAVLGSFQSGALGWFAEGTGCTVVNLDGVVDGEAALALREGRVAAFARSRGVTHLADWDVNVKLFLARSGDPRLVRASLRPLATAEPQGDDERFVLYAVDWP